MFPVSWQMQKMRDERAAEYIPHAPVGPQPCASQDTTEPEQTLDQSPSGPRRRSAFDLVNEFGVGDIEQHGEHGNIGTADRQNSTIEVLALQLDLVEKTIDDTPEFRRELLKTGEVDGDPLGWAEGGWDDVVVFRKQLVQGDVVTRRQAVQPRKGD